MATVNRCLAPLAAEGRFLDELWLSLDEVVKLQECEVYSYLPDMEDDPFR